jgi:hypothetical protein
MRSVDVMACLRKLTICGNILSLTTFCGRRSIIDGRLSNKQTRIARSGLANSRTITGVMLDSNSSSDNLAPIFIITPMTLGPPPPNSIDLSNSGRTFILKNSSGKSSDRSSSSLKSQVSVSKRGGRTTGANPRNSSRSASFLRPRLSIP